jgi:hypothetical protein
MLSLPDESRVPQAPTVPWVEVPDPGASVAGQVKWDTEGREVAGRWAGIAAGKFGDLGMVDTPEHESITFSLPLVLRRRLVRVPLGSEVVVRYLGSETLANGNTLKRFSVAVREGTPLLDPATSTSDTAAAAPTVTPLRRSAGTKVPF